MQDEEDEITRKRPSAEREVRVIFDVAARKLTTEAAKVLLQIVRGAT